MPPLISTLLDHPATFVVARVILTTLFWSEVILGITNFPAFVEAMKRVSLPFPKFFAVLTILLQLVGSVLLITNVSGLGWFGAGMLGVFTLLTIPYGHAFWKFPQPRRTQELHFVLEHITVVGGLLLAAILLTKG
ncbi:DoxX family protein [Paracoccus sp. TOH]|uniref:DoxX family protein n=1 Tax=Paracoccus sp. TOH TaxID=1263728 RepID=UPI0025AFB979|nr:DoxX family protein [Paracoccus sp. TOH]WJS87137.1 DoxX family protein [Paracoccus sp. TOH]